MLVLSHPALAESVRVAVIHSARQDGQARRLRAEVAAAGFDAVDVPLPPGEDRSTAQIAYALGAVSALRTLPEGELELVIIDSDTGSVRQSSVLRSTGEPAELALRAVEDLRARLVELATLVPRAVGEGPRPPPTPSAADTGRPVQRKHEVPEAGRGGTVREPRGAAEGAPLQVAGPLRVWLQGAAGVVVSAGGLGPGAVSTVGILVEPAGRWSISCRALLPLSEQRLATELGAATMDAGLLTGMVGFAPFKSPVVELDIAVGAGAGLFTMSGVPAKLGDEGRAHSLWAGVGFAELALAINASHWLRLRATASMGVTAPRPVIRFEGEEVGTWGRPFAAATLGIEFDALSAVRGLP